MDNNNTCFDSLAERIAFNIVVWGFCAGAVALITYLGYIVHFAR